MSYNCIWIEWSGKCPTENKVEKGAKGKFDRLLKILNLLDRGGSFTSTQLAEECGVDQRTVFRYLNSLKDTGFPIDYDEARKTYLFLEGYKLRKTFLDTDEILALAVAKQLLKSMGNAFDDAIDKLEKKIVESTRLCSRSPHSAILLPDCVSR